MKIPPGLQPLLDDGLIDAVVRPLKSGKEASVYIVRSGAGLLCAKVYKDLAQRSFQARARYQEGRSLRGSRAARAAAGRGSRFGRRAQEDAWKNAEVDALYQLAAAGVRVPAPRSYVHGVLLMDLVTGIDGQSAPRLDDVDLDAAQARAMYMTLMAEIVRMLCLGLVHGDLSPYNVLVAADGPVIIDLPQVVSAAGNNGARAMLLRDVHGLRASLARQAPDLHGRHDGEEMWALFETGKLAPDSALTGRFAFDQSAADVASVMGAIEDARQVALIREQGRAAAAGD